MCIRDSSQVIAPDDSTSGIDVHSDLLSSTTEMCIRDSVQILFQIFLPDNLPAVLTLHPQPFGTNRLLARSVEFPGFALEPSHISCAYRIPSTESNPRFPVAGTRYQVLPAYSILDPSLRHHALLISVLHLPHLCHGVCGLDNCGVCVPPRQDEMCIRDSS